MANPDPSAATCNHGERSATCPVCTSVIQTSQDEEFELPATKREPLLKWLRSPCDAPNWLVMALSLMLVIVSLFSLMGVGK